MFTAPIGVDRAVERNIRRLVARDDRARLLEARFGAQRRWGFLLGPAIVKGFSHLRFISPREIGDRAAAMAVRIGQPCGVPGLHRLLGQTGNGLAHDKNKSRTRGIRQGPTDTFLPSADRQK